MTHHSPMKSTILLLVSDSLVLSVLEETLERAGYTVVAASNLGQAVDLLKRCRPDLLITRTYIDGLPGHDAAIYLRGKCVTMSVLMVGGLLDDERLKHRAGLVGFEVFPKPYAAAELLQKVKDVLSRPHG